MKYTQRKLGNSGHTCRGMIYSIPVQVRASMGDHDGFSNLSSPSPTHPFDIKGEVMSLTQWMAPHLLPVTVAEDTRGHHLLNYYNSLALTPKPSVTWSGLSLVLFHTQPPDVKTPVDPILLTSPLGPLDRQDILHGLLSMSHPGMEYSFQGVG